MTTGSSPWLSNLKGKFVVFDGPDGSGKTTQFRRFSRYAQEQGLSVCEVYEPGGTEIGVQIRKILLDPTNKEEIDVAAETLLFMASRAQLMAQRIRPALEEGKLVLADRFISSTLAYQGAAGGMSQDDILAMGRIALGKHWPDLVVLFDIDENTASARLAPLLKQDRIEQKGREYHRKVRAGFLSQAKRDPDHYAVLDASRDHDQVFDTILDILQARFTTETGVAGGA
jgi:dTMP kinase